MSETVLNYVIVIFASIGFLVMVCFLGELIFSLRKKSPDRMVSVVFVSENAKDAECQLRSLMFDLDKTAPAYARGRVVAVDMGLYRETEEIIQRLCREYGSLFYATRENYLDVVQLLMEN